MSKADNHCAHPIPNGSLKLDLINERTARLTIVGDDGQEARVDLSKPLVGQVLDTCGHFFAQMVDDE